MKKMNSFFEGSKKNEFEHIAGMIGKIWNQKWYFLAITYWGNSININ